MYERNWRLIDLEKMTPEEKKLIEQLKNEVGKGCLLV
jgi:DNA replication initiation complex subunit (GINS family)